MITVAKSVITIKMIRMIRTWLQSGVKVSREALWSASIAVCTKKINVFKLPHCSSFIFTSLRTISSISLFYNLTFILIFIIFQVI